MKKDPTTISQTAAVFLGGGEMGALMRSIDWSKTPIGPLDGWSPTLRMMISFLLANRFPLLLWWGPPEPFTFLVRQRRILKRLFQRERHSPVRPCTRRGSSVHTRPAENSNSVLTSLSMRKASGIAPDRGVSAVT